MTTEKKTRLEVELATIIESSLECFGFKSQRTGDVGGLHRLDCRLDPCDDQRLTL
jgi:hypothetical protein